PVQLPVFVERYLARRAWPWSDQAHLALDYIPQLRQLVDAPATDEHADVGAPRVIPHLEDRAFGLIVFEQLRQPLIGIGSHRPELPDDELAPATTDSRLSVQRRPSPIFQPDEERERNEEPREQDQNGQRDNDVDDPFHEEIHAEDGVVLHTHQRNAIDGVNVEAAQTDLVQVGHKAELHAVASTVIDDAHDGFV